MQENYMDINKRKHHRVDSKTLSIDISDGIGFSSGGAVDISRFGMCLVNLSKRISRDSDNYTVVATTNDGKIFKFKVRPRWEQSGLSSKTLGVEIENPPSKWVEYVKSLEPGSGVADDVWTAASDR
jgi:hypothetical protein